MPGVRWPSQLAGRHGRSQTEVLDPMHAGVLADPDAGTQVIAADPAPGSSTDPRSETTLLPGGERRSRRPVAPTPPLLTRGQAAEVGIYVGAGLMALAVLVQAMRGWEGTATWVQAVSLGLSSFVLVAIGLFVRLPWSRTLGPQRRRAISVLLVSGASFALIGIGGAADVRRGAEPALLAFHAGICVVVMLLVCWIARTPASESGVLGALAWSVWLLAPSSAWAWLGLVVLGVAWVLAGTRWAYGPATAQVTGSVLALVSAVGLAQGEWVWVVAAALAGLSVTGLVLFVRGGPNHWLALGAASATALAGSITGRQGPLLALSLGGLAIMLVSGVALRSASRPARRATR